MTVGAKEIYSASTVKRSHLLLDPQWEHPVPLCFTVWPCAFYSVFYACLRLIFKTQKDVFMLNETLSSCDGDQHLIPCFAVPNSNCTLLRQYNYCQQESSGSEEDMQPPCCPVHCLLGQMWREICWTENSCWKLFFQTKGLKLSEFLMVEGVKRQWQNHLQHVNSLQRGVADQSSLLFALFSF